MSKIALSSNASGTGVFTLVSPGTNTNRTLTLPDATGTVNISGLANEVPSGSAALPAIYPTGDNNTGIFFPAADTIAFAEGGVESMRIDSAGNVGIGITPSAFNAAYRALQFQDGSIISPNNGSFVFVSNVYTDATETNRYVKNNFATYHDHFNGAYRWFTAPSGTAGNAITLTPVMTLDASGNFMVGAATALALATFEKTTEASPVIVAKNPQYSLDCWATNTTGSNVFVRFFTETSATSRGSITYNRGGGLVAYNTTSDYRAKDITGEISNASSTVLSLKPYMGTMKGATIERPMFIAHETQEIAPYAVTGEKDAVDNEGNPTYQQMDHSALVPLLTAALQEALAEIANLKIRITALEATQ